MLKIQRNSNHDVVLAVCGQLCSDNVDELATLLAQERGSRKLILDLKDLLLVDRPSVRFLKECEMRGVALRNCPTYIRLWIESGPEEL